MKDLELLFTKNGKEYWGKDGVVHRAKVIGNPKAKDTLEVHKGIFGVKSKIKKK